MQMPIPDPGSGQAIAGFVLSLVGAFVFPILLIPGIILSIIGLRSTRQHGLALAGLIISIVFIAIWVLVILVIIIALSAASSTPP